MPLASITQQSKAAIDGLLKRLAAGAVQQGASQVADEARTPGARVAASVAAGGAGSSRFAVTTKGKDQMTLDYRPESIDGITLAAKVRKHKAASAREDLLTSLIELAAEDIANTAAQ